MSKQIRIIRDLEQQIALGQLRPGELLPPQRQLMRHYGVAIGTIQQAMSQLQSRGIVVARRGKGTVISDSEALVRTGITRARVEMIRIGAPTRQYPQLSDLAYAIGQELAARGLDLMIRAEVPEASGALAAWARGVRAVVAAGDLPPKVRHALQAAGRPIVVLGELFHEACPPGVGQVRPALQAKMDLAMAWLQAIGHRRILFARGDWSYSLETAGHAFHESVARLGCAGDCEEMLFTLDETQSPAKLIDVLKRRPAQARPTALLVDGGMFACRTIFQLQAAGIAVPEQLSVFALSVTQPDHLPLPSLSRAETPPERIGQRLADVLLESLRTGAVIRDLVPPSLHRGDTARAVALDNA